MRSNTRNILFGVLVCVLLVALYLSIFPPFPFPSPGSQPSSVQAATPTQGLATGNNPASKTIANENAQPGTTNWQIPTDKLAYTEIQAYTSATSVAPGDKLTFYVSTQKSGTPFFIDIYRLGWYGGAGGRHMNTSVSLTGQAQGYYDEPHATLVGCTTCHVDTNTGLIEANWKPSYTFAIPADWTTGIYLAKFTDANGLQTYAPFDVRGNYSSRYIVVTPDTTYAAYDAWGGYSLYAASGSESSEVSKQGRGVMVSFDRPYERENGAAQVLLYGASMIHWMERQGYDVSYTSDVDLHSNPGQLLKHRAYISFGHDEYWSKEMRDGVQLARDRGVGLAFLGADTAYWQIRFSPDSQGVANRVIVCYKVETKNNDLKNDPFYGKDDTRITTLWRDPFLHRPENELIGQMYSSYIQTPTGFPWKVSAQAASAPLVAGTGLQPGKEYSCNVVGYEWDRVANNGLTPRDLHIVGESSAVDVDKNNDVSNTTYYVAQSGALVFSSGTINWTTTLDSYRLHPNLDCAGKDTVVPEIQKFMAKVMDALVVTHSLQEKI